MQQNDLPYDGITSEIGLNMEYTECPVRKILMKRNEAYVIISL